LVAVYHISVETLAEKNKTVKIIKNVEQFFFFKLTKNVDSVVFKQRAANHVGYKM